METSRIAAFPVFADLPEAELDELAGAVHELAVAERSTVVTVDDYGDAVYLVEEETAGVLNERGETTRLSARATRSARSASS
jgi:hypothetical protein